MHGEIEYMEVVDLPTPLPTYLYLPTCLPAYLSACIREEWHAPLGPASVTLYDNGPATITGEPRRARAG